MNFESKVREGFAIDYYQKVEIDEEDQRCIRKFAASWDWIQQFFGGV